MTSTRPYSRDSVDRALQHHELSGAIRQWSPPEQPGPGNRKTYRVTLVDTETLVLSLREAYVLCVGLAAAEKAANRAV